MRENTTGKTAGSVLIVGGSGVVGRQAARWLRLRQPDLPLLIGGRRLDVANEVAQKVGAAEAIAIDLDKPRLGLGDDVRIAAVVMLAPDDGLHGLTYAQDLGVPYVNIGNGLVEVGPELALLAHRPTAAPVILASQWLGGAALFLSLRAARKFDDVHAIRIGALLDEDDAAGPSALHDMARLHDVAPAALAFKDGRRTWLTGEAAKGEIRSIDGRTLEAQSFSPFDAISLYAVTRAPNIRFDIVSDQSSSRLRGAETAAEIIVEIEGTIDGKAARSRSTLEFKEGQASLTALCVVLSLSSALGLEGKPPAPGAIYLPELLWDAQAFLDQLARSGVAITEETT